MSSVTPMPYTWENIQAPVTIIVLAVLAALIIAGLFTLGLI